MPISLFSGAGRLDLGCEAAGFRPQATVELHEIARSTLLNPGKFFPSLAAERVLSDIVDPDYASVLSSSGLIGGDVSFVHASVMDELAPPASTPRSLLNDEGHL